MRKLLALLVAALVAVGCGGGGDGDVGDAAEPGAAAVDDGAATPTEDEEVAAAFPPECPGETPFTMSVRSEGKGELEPFEVIDSAALRKVDGVAFTVYLADFEIPDDTAWDFDVPVVPSGSLLVTTGLDVFNTDPGTLDPLEVGAEGGMFREVGDGETAAVLNMSGDVVTGSTNQDGSATLLGLDDERICIEVSITSDDGQAIDGVYEAPIVADI